MLNTKINDCCIYSFFSTVWSLMLLTFSSQVAVNLLSANVSSFHIMRRRIYHDTTALLPMIDVPLKLHTLKNHNQHAPLLIYWTLWAKTEWQTVTNKMAHIELNAFNAFEGMPWVYILLYHHMAKTSNHWVWKSMSYYIAITQTFTWYFFPHELNLWFIVHIPTWLLFQHL